MKIVKISSYNVWSDEKRKGLRTWSDPTRKGLRTFKNGHCEQSAVNKALPVWAAHSHPQTHITNMANCEAFAMGRQNDSAGLDCDALPWLALPILRM